MEPISEYLEVCQQACHAAAKLLLDKMGRVSTRKKGPRDLVTEADLAAQDIMQKTVLAAFPAHKVLGEERGAQDQVESSGSDHGYRWIVDPLDGTTNFVHQVPHFAISLALERQGQLLAATVLDPISQECFTAGLGTGAKLNGQPIEASRVEAPDEALCAVGFAADVASDSLDLQAFLRALPRCQALRRTGSAALNVAYVAAGRFDACWAFSTKIWDIAAGVLLVQEAGGTVTAPDGGPLQLDSGQFLASANRPLHEAMLEVISP